MTDVYPTRWLWETSGRNPKCGRPQTRPPEKGFLQAVILHTTDGPRDSIVHEGGAAATAHWQNTQRKAWSGYHFLLDQSEIIGQCNPANTKANHAGVSWGWKKQGMGNRQIGVSIAGRADHWDYALAGYPEAVDEVLDNLAALAVELYERFGVPLRRVTLEQYKNGQRGWLGHMDVARPKGRKPDPGTAFPWDVFIAKAKTIQSKKEEPVKDDGHVAAKAEDGGLVFKDPASRPGGGMFGEAFWEALRAANATPRSVAYNLRFYRQVAKRLGVPGDKPEVIANRLMDSLEKGKK